MDGAHYVHSSQSPLPAKPGVLPSTGYFRRAALVRLAVPAGGAHPQRSGTAAVTVQRSRVRTMTARHRYHRNLLRKPSRRGVLLLLVPLVALLAGAFAAFARYDAQQGRVARNVTLGGDPVGGMTRSELAATATQVASRYAVARVTVVAPPGGFSSDAAAMGLSVQVAPTVDATLALHRSGSRIARFIAWARSFFGARIAPLTVEVDEESVRRQVIEKDAARTPPTEPAFRVVGENLEVVEGKPGTGIDAADVIAALPAAAAKGVPIRVEVERGQIPPRFSVADAAGLITEAEAQTSAGLAVKAGNKQLTVPAAQLRTWLRLRAAGAGLEFFVDEEAANAGLRELFPEADPKPQEATYAIVNGQVVVGPSKPGAQCCTDAAGALVAKAVAVKSGQPIELPTRPVPPKEVVLADPLAQGLKEQVSTFTTNFPPGQPRVTNIQLMADLVKGQVIKPGSSFSVNKFVGPRTTAKGFVVDKIIDNGKFGKAVGGGISQFATTLFNAGFFAGMEFPAYQSHSLYISRYPYGREATLSFPNPDLVLRNPSPYSVLIWPTYTGSSITVSLYSTKWVNAEQTGQTAAPRNQCTLVRTQRTRTLLANGMKMVDWVTALYRPAEGVDCSTPAPAGSGAPRTTPSIKAPASPGPSVSPPASPTPAPGPSPHETPPPSPEVLPSFPF